METKMKLPNTVVNFIEKSIRVMEANGVIFEIRMPNGDVYGGLPQDTAGAKRKRPFKHSPGELRDHIMRDMADLEVGDVATVPLFNGYDVHEMQCAVTARAHLMWGKGSYTSTITDDRLGIEILRVS